MENTNVVNEVVSNENNEAAVVKACPLANIKAEHVALGIIAAIVTVKAAKWFGTKVIKPAIEKHKAKKEAAKLEAEANNNNDTDNVQ